MEGNKGFFRCSHGFPFYHKIIMDLVKGGNDYIITHLYTRYALPSFGWLYNPYHPLQEPESSIDFS